MPRLSAIRTCRPRTPAPAFICVWDDHEVANDDWIGGAENHDPATEGDWQARKTAAMQAYFEWMPIRDPLPGQPWAAINRSFEFGDLATLAMVETRLLARSKQVAAKGEAITPAEYAPMMAERARPDRELLGPGQQRWLETVLGRSVKAGKPWQVLGNQVVMAKIAGPDIEAQLGAERYAALLATLPVGWAARLKASIAATRAGLPFNFDSWDGYPPARERLYQAFRRAGCRPVVLSGDSHAAWANVLHDDGKAAVAVEFGATAVTSPSYGALLPGIGALIAQANDEVLFCDQDHKGYLLLTLTPEAATRISAPCRPCWSPTIARRPRRATGAGRGRGPRWKNSPDAFPYRPVRNPLTGANRASIPSSIEDRGGSRRRFSGSPGRMPVIGSKRGATWPWQQAASSSMRQPSACRSKRE
ncbi:MAG: alkaline phosphatase D family protein [Sphingomonas taxi]